MIKIDRNDFVNALKLCKHVLPSSSPIPAVQNILMRVSGDELQMISTDLTAMITASIPIVENDNMELDTTIDGGKVDAVIPKMENDLVRIDKLDSGKIKISSSRKYSTFATISSSEFPMIDADMPDEGYIDIDPGVFSRRLQAAMTMVGGSVNDRPMNALSGIFIQGSNNQLCIVSSDGTRIYFSNLPVEISSEFDALLWLSGHQGIYKNLTAFTNLKVASSGQRFFMRGKLNGVSIEFVSLTMSGEYPDIHNFAFGVHDDMENPVHILVDAGQFKNDLAPTIKFEKLFISITLEENMLIFESLDENDSYRVELDAQIKGDYKNFQIFLSKSYIRDVLNNISAPMVQISVDNSKKSFAAFMLPSNGEFREEIGEELFLLAKMEV